MQVVDLDGTYHVQVPLFDVVVNCASVSHLEHAVNIALIDDSEGVFWFPLEPGANYLDRLFTFYLVPVGTKEVSRQIHIDILCLSILNHEMLLSEVHVELVFEIWREKVRHACCLSKRSRELLNAVLNLPFDLLATVFKVNPFIEVFACMVDFSIAVHVVTRVNCRSQVVHNFHHAICVLT